MLRYAAPGNTAEVKVRLVVGPLIKGYLKLPVSKVSDGSAESIVCQYGFEFWIKRG